MSELKTEIQYWVDKIEKLHVNDSVICEYWNEMTNILCRDEDATIDFVNGLTDGSMVDNLSSVFDDVSSRLQSTNFIKCIESLESRFPDLQLKHMIEAARNQLID